MRIELFSTMFWGIYFIIVGVLAIIRSFGNVDFSLFRVAVGVFLAYVGIIVLLGGGYVWQSEPDLVVMEKRLQEITESGEYSTIFGEGVYDVRIDNPAGQRVAFNTVFGSTTITLPRDVPVRVVASSAFGSVSTPDGASTVFGEQTYLSGGAGESNTLQIKVSVVFGSVVIRHR